MSKPTKEVEKALSGGSGGSGKPQNSSLKYGGNPQDPAFRAWIAERIRQKKLVGLPEMADGIRQKLEAARQGGDDVNKVPPTPSPSPVPSTPVPLNEVPKPETGITPPSFNQSGPSALAGGVGEDSFGVSLTQMEERCRHHLMQSMAFVHQLSLRAAFWEEMEAESNARVKKVEADLKKAEEALALANSQMKEVLAKHKEEMVLKDQELVLLAKDTEELKSSQKQKFEAGKRKGREDFLQSEEFQTMLKKARHDGVLDFKKSTEYVVLSQAVGHVMAAVNTCQAQLQKLGDLNEGSELSQLDAIKTENLEDYPDAPPPDFVIDEFRST